MRSTGGTAWMRSGGLSSCTTQRPSTGGMARPTSMGTPGSGGSSGQAFTRSVTVFGGGHGGTPLNQAGPGSTRTSTWRRSGATSGGPMKTA
jgi:hypothetical protein